jgi:lantibiotic modifying enzyme
MDPLVALQHAIDAEAFIDSLRVPNEETAELRWRQTTDPDAPSDLTLYHGSAGIIVFLLELAEATGDSTYRERAIAAGRVLVHGMRTKQWASVSFSTGWAGYAFALQTLSDHTGLAEFRETAAHCLDRLIAQSQSIGSGIGWIEPAPFGDITGFKGEREIFDLSVGAAGAGMMMLHAHKTSLHPRAYEWACSIGERLLEVGEVTEHGTRWGLMSDMPFPFTAPNFAHGGAGVGYFFAHLYDASKDRRYLDAAVSAANYLKRKATAVGVDAFLVCHTEEQQPPMFYLGECHGPAGTWRLLATLARLTGNAEWTYYASALRKGVDALGAPVQRSWGWWNNHSQCCGDAGLGDSALAMWAATGDTEYRMLAHRCADVISRAATRNAVAPATSDVARSEAEMGTISKYAGLRWEQAEHRSRPTFVQSQTGYMQGAAGIGSFFVHLATATTKPSARILFPDEML